MLNKSESRAFSKRRHNYSWMIICTLLLGGIALIGLAFTVFSSGNADEDVPVARHIEKHASSESGMREFTPSPSPQPSPASQPAKPVPAAPSQAPKPPAAKTSTQPQAPSPNQDKALSGAKLLLSQPTCPGCTPPRVGRYHLIKSQLAYDRNASPEAIAAAQATAYIVVSGDILGRIANRYGCTIEQIQKANRMTSDQIRIGQKLFIPNCSGDEPIVPLVAEPVKPLIKKGTWWKTAGVNTTSLPALMRSEGFKPPQKFMAFVIELTFDKTRQTVIQERAFDYNGSSLNTDWNPASTVKIFAAIGALKRIEELGFSSRAKVTFSGKKTYTTTVSDLIEAAIIQSDNIAYNRVAQLASFEKLHTDILTSKYGIARTALNRGYQLKDWEAMGEDPSLRVSPVITLTEGKRSLKLPAATSKAPVNCSSTACTTLQDLGEITRRLMLQEQLDPSESFSLAQSDLLMLRRAMRSEDRTRGTEMVDIFAKIFKDPRVKFYSKPGFSADWFTDNVYIFDPRYNQAWIVVMSGYPGRKSLNSAATAIGKIISSGRLRALK